MGPINAGTWSMRCIAAGVQKAPWLRVERRRRPMRRIQHREQLSRRNRLTGKCTRRPSIEKHRIDRKLRLAGIEFRHVLHQACTNDLDESLLLVNIL